MGGGRKNEENRSNDNLFSFEKLAAKMKKKNKKKKEAIWEFFSEKSVNNKFSVKISRHKSSGF